MQIRTFALELTVLGSAGRRAVSASCSKGNAMQPHSIMGVIFKYRGSGESERALGLFCKGSPKCGFLGRGTHRPDAST